MAAEILRGVSLRVEAHQRWVIIGASDSGKTTLMRVLALCHHPASGSVDALGERLGRTDVRELRQRIVSSSAALAEKLRNDLFVHGAVRSARHEPWGDVSMFR